MIYPSAIASAVTLSAATLLSFAGLGAGSFFTTPAPAALAGLGVGDFLPAPDIEDFQQTDAKSFDDYAGRVILVEFFEYW